MLLRLADDFAETPPSRPEAAIVRLGSRGG
jgi:hypothetical protein